MKRALRPLTLYQGVTLIELMVVLAIIAIFLMFALPSYENVQTGDRIASEMNDLNGDVEFARISAVSRGIPVTICASTDLKSCSDSASWGTGWIIFSDFNGDHSLQSTQGDTLLRVHSPLAGGSQADTLTGKAGQPGNFSGNLEWLTINRMGATTQGVLSLHNAANDPQWRHCLIVPMTGKTYTDTETNNPGVCP